MTNYTEVIARKMIEDKAQKAAGEIGFKYDDSVADQIEIGLHNTISITENFTIKQMENLVDETVECWKDDTLQNYPEQCSF